MTTNYETCHLCQDQGEFLCSSCHNPSCGKHSKFRIVCSHCIPQRTCHYTLREATCDDAKAIKELVLLFWGDPIQLMFNQSYTVPDEPAFVAVDKEQVIGFLSYTNFGEDAVLIVALGVQPRYQGCGIGHSLIQKAEDYAKSQFRDQLLVVTSNDDLPALAFYQRQGFQLFEVIPDVIAQKLGGMYNGIGNIPIRDELRLRKQLNKSK